MRQGISDGFLAPYKVVRIDLDKDIDGWRPSPGQLDKYGQLIEDRMFNQLDMDRSLVLDQRTKIVAWKITEYLKATDRFAKTIVFCEKPSFPSPFEGACGPRGRQTNQLWRF